MAASASVSPSKKGASATPASQEKKKAAVKPEPTGTGADIRNFVRPPLGGLVRSLADG